MVAISSIGIKQTSATEATSLVVNQLLDYVTTYPNDVITYRARDIVAAAHADDSLLNVSKGRSHAGVHIFLSEDYHVLRLNGPILTIAQMIKFVISSVAESELSGLFITPKAMVPL